MWYAGWQVTLWWRCLPCCCCSISKSKEAKLCNLGPESVQMARNSAQKPGFQLTIKESNSSGIMHSQTTLKGVAFSMIQHWLCSEEVPVKWWTIVSFSGGEESWCIERWSSEYCKAWLAKVKGKKRSSINTSYFSPHSWDAGMWPPAAGFSWLLLFMEAELSVFHGSIPC